MTRPRRALALACLLTMAAGATMSIGLDPAAADTDQDHANARPPAVAANPIDGSWPVYFRDIWRGEAFGTLWSLSGPLVDGTVYVCDDEDEPGETNIVRARFMAAFTNGSSWQYRDGPWLNAPGDGAGCEDYWYSQPGPAGYWAGYMRITVQAPGKHTEVYYESF